MSSTFSLPDPCLVALLLVCQTRAGSGPQLVFNWPPDALSKASKKQSQTFDEDGESTDTTGDSSSEDDFYELGDQRRAAHLNTTTSASAPHRPDRVRSEQKGDGSKQKSKTLMGIDEDGIVGLLAPDRSWNKRKFEMSFNDLTFVGRPIFAKQNGSWSRQKNPTLARSRPVSPSPAIDADDDSSEPEATTVRKEVRTDMRSELSMFHVVFVLNPPPLDYNLRVREMYDNIIKKLTKALKWVQAKHDFVWKEISTLLGERQRLIADSEQPPPNLLAQLAKSSTLAQALVAVFDAVASSRIATLNLGPGAALTLQIPPITSTSYLPTLTEPPLPPGLWLTTATEAPSRASVSDKRSSLSQVTLAKSYTLLLKSPPQRIAKDAQAAGDNMASHLPRFVAALRPTKSFHKLANDHKISLNDIQVLASHLIYYRRAIAIPPLSQRDTYIVSPNADFRKINEACSSYEAQFPASLPSLPRILSLLSGIPLPYEALIPSPDHKDIYMLLLAWLMRNGWVTQLRTFAFIRVSSEIKQQARQWERDSRTSVSQSYNSANDSKKDDVSGPTRPSFVSTQSSDGRQSIKNIQNDKSASLIKNPPRATPEESRWLRFLQESILEGEDLFHGFPQEERVELYHNWLSLSRHFDGITALESIPIKENLKRQLAWSLYRKFGLDFERGVEDHDGSNDRILVTVRHW